MPAGLLYAATSVSFESIQAFLLNTKVLVLVFGAVAGTVIFILQVPEAQMARVKFVNEHRAAPTTNWRFEP